MYGYIYIYIYIYIHAYICWIYILRIYILFVCILCTDILYIRTHIDIYAYIICTYIYVSWTHDLIAQLVRASERTSVVVGSNHSGQLSIATSKESFRGEYHMYQLIPLHPCDYLKKLSIQVNVATDKGNSPNEMWHWTNDETRVAVQSWLSGSWTHGLLAQSVRASEFTKTYLSIAKALTKYSLLSGCYGTLTFM